MHARNVLPQGYKLCTLACVGVGLALSGARADSLTYDSGANTGWFTADAWQGPDTWQADDSATIDAAVNVQFDGSTTIDNLTFTAFNDSLRLESASARTLTFSGGTITLGTLSFLRISSLVSLQGDYTMVGSGFLRYESSAVAAYVGTATLNGGVLDWAFGSELGTNSNFIINGAYLNNRQNGASSIGSVTLNSGTFDLGRSNSSTNNSTTTVTSLSGTGGNIIGIARNGAPSTTLLRTLNVNQTGTTSFAGNIAGVNDGARIAFNKQGVGDLTLSGTITLARQTNVTGGRLYISGTNSNFSNDQAVGGTAIEVNGGTLGGVGTMLISDGDNVVLTSTGKLAAGIVGAAGRTAYNFSGGGNLDLSAATAGAATGWLLFDLGADTLAGSSYDQIQLSAGTLNIGTGLNFDDFGFSLLGGFAPGNYTLFKTEAAIVGSLGTTTGSLGGYDVTLSVSGNDLVMNVVPEAQTAWLVFGAAAFFLLSFRRSGRSRVV